MGVFLLTLNKLYFNKIVKRSYDTDTLEKYVDMYNAISFKSDGMFVKYGFTINQDEKYLRKGKNNTGLYKTSNDTIIAQCIGNRPSSMNRWTATQEMYIIESINTLIKIQETPMDIFSESDWNNYNKTRKLQFKPSKYEFKEFPDSLIPANSYWIKTQKWFWCNETDWSNYMDKERKKQKSKNK